MEKRRLMVILTRRAAARRREMRMRRREISLRALSGGVRSRRSHSSAVKNWRYRRAGAVEKNGSKARGAAGSAGMRKSYRTNVLKSRKKVFTVFKKGVNFWFG
jgi:hypothetical protein